MVYHWFEEKMLRMFEYRAISYGNQEVIIVEYGNNMYEYWILLRREEYWLDNNSRRVNKDFSFVIWIVRVWSTDQHIIWNRST